MLQIHIRCIFSIEHISVLNNLENAKTNIKDSVHFLHVLRYTKRSVALTIRMYLLALHGP